MRRIAAFIACLAWIPMAPAEARTQNIHDALIVSAGEGDLSSVDTLLKLGADPHAVNRRGQTALIAAAHGKHNAVAKRLLEAGANINAEEPTPQNAFMIACVGGNLELVRMALAAGADLNSRNQYGGNCLIPACHYGHVEVVRELLKTRIDRNHVNGLGWTALLETVILGDGGPRHTEIARMLVAAGADPNIADRDGVTPLQHAKRKGQAAIVAILTAAGAK